MNKQIKTIFAEYEQYLLEIKCLKPASVEQRIRHIKYFHNFLNDKDLSKITLKEVYSLVLHLKNRKRTYHSRYSYQGSGKLHLRTVKNYITSIREFFKRFKGHGNDCLDPFCIASPKVRPPKVDTLPEEIINQIVKLPAKLHKQRKDFMYRDTLLILVGTLMGLRIHEAISLTFDDLLSPSGFVNILGKGAKDRVLPIPKVIRKLAAEYQKIRGGTKILPELNIINGKEVIKYKKYIDRNPHYVFTSLGHHTYGNQLGRKGMSRMLRKYEKEMGGGIRINYHAFRHTFCTQLIKKGANLKTAQEMMGHTTILTTQHYIQVDRENMKSAQMLLLGNHII